MMSLIVGGVFAVAALGTRYIPVPEGAGRLRNFAGGALLGIGVLTAGFGAVNYNDAGVCTHIRTITGAEDVECQVGWYFSGWGQTTQWSHFITVSHTKEPTEGSVSDLPPYRVRMADNWAGDVLQTTRFGIPQDRESFLKMAHDFRTPERMIVTTLKPAVTSSLDSVANLFSMEEYWSGGKRDEFKTEYEDAIKKGRAQVDRKEEFVDNLETDETLAPSNSDVAQDTSNNGSSRSTRFVTVKRLDKNGEPIRIKHEYIDYGITVSSAIVEQIDPDDAFEQRIGERKEAASRRIIARERRLEEEEQRLLAITTSEREQAEKQGKAKVAQIEATTNAETKKKLALIESEQTRESARIAKETSLINLDKAKVDAESVKVTADAAAYERDALIKADNALDKKLNTELEIQKVWADAYARRNVPSVVMGGGADGVPVGGDSEVSNFMNLLTIDAAKRLAYDRAVTQTQNAGSK